jgi:hypothetical protein
MLLWEAFMTFVGSATNNSGWFREKPKSRWTLPVNRGVILLILLMAICLA